MMGTLAVCEGILKAASFYIRKTVFFLGEIRGIWKKRFLYSEVTLTKEQEDEIADFYKKHYGKRISTKWHRLYQSYTGNFRADYFPEILFSTVYEPMVNPYRKAEFLEDKNLLPRLFGDLEGAGIRVPKTVISCIDGVIRDRDGHTVPSGAAADLLREINRKVVVKKSIYSNSGRDFLIVVPSETDVKATLSRFGKDYVVQELVEQSPALNKLYPNSVNTFRVPTYTVGDGIYTSPVVLRLGRSGADRDNMHYGGIGVGVNEDGTLKKTAVTEYGERFDAHPDTGVVFEHYEVPGAGIQIRKAAKKLHARIPLLGFISWDLTIDRNGDITVIEMNTAGQSSSLSQRTNGESLFGNNTAAILEMIRKRRNA